MRYSILFVLALILVSGFIAYFGDILGRRMGKKRLTLFNLRPRYTAIVVTTITGMLISGLVVLALISVNSEFRKVLTEGERTFTQNKRLSTENLTLIRNNDSLTKRRGELLQLVAERKKDLDAAKERVKKAMKAKEAAAAVVRRLEADIATRKKAIELLSGRKFAVDAELDQRNQELAGVQAKLAQAQTNLQKRQADLKVVGFRLTTTATNLDKANRSLSDVQGKLTETQRKLLDIQRKLQAKTHELEAKNVELFSEQAEKIHFQQQSNELRSGNLVLRQGDEIARGVISPEQPAFGVKADLQSLLGKAGENAEKRGAGVGAKGRAVSLIFRSSDGGISDKIIESECLIVARDSIVRSRSNVLVQVVCARNTVAGEQALVEFVLYPNNLVFSKGQSIASTQMNGRFSEGRVLLSVITFLQGPVADSAVAGGVIPVANYDPRQSMGVNPQKQLDELLNVVDQIRSKRSKVDVTAYACADIYAADPINMDNLRFSVTKVE